MAEELNETAEPREIPSGPDRLIVKADIPKLSPEAAFTYWTRPELITKWWPQEAEIEPRLGGRYHLAWPGMNWHLRGVYTAFEPGRRLAFTWRWDHEPDAPERSVDITFAPGGEGTHLTATHGTYADTDADREERQGHLDGWTHFLSQLQKQS
jgi:uncharacterized protein YndB with AHSA1/START domain